VRVLDVFIYLGLALGLMAMFIGSKWMSAAPFYVATGLFLILGAFIITEGWETYENGDLNFDYDGNGDLNRVYFRTINYPATLEANPIIFLLGNLFVAMSLINVFLGLDQARRNSAVSKAP